VKGRGHAEIDAEAEKDEEAENALTKSLNLMPRGEDEASMKDRRLGWNAD